MHKLFILINFQYMGYETDQHIAEAGRLEQGFSLCLFDFRSTLNTE